MADLERIEAQKNIEDLKRKLEVGHLSSNEKLKLAALYASIDEELSAIEIYEEILSENPNIFEAKMWLAWFLNLYNFGQKERIEKAISLAKEISSTSNSYQAAGHQILVALSYEESQQTKIDRILELECSVRHAPEWYFNNRYLAEEYEKRGELKDALKYYEIALSNLIDGFDPEWDKNKRMFEDQITGRPRGEFQRKGLEKHIEKLRVEVKGS